MNKSELIERLKEIRAEQTAYQAGIMSDQRPNCTGANFHKSVATEALLDYIGDADVWDAFAEIES